MTPEQVSLVERSFKQVAPIADAAAVIFYDRLFALDPSLRPMFGRAEMGEQRRKLMAAIGFVVANLRRPGQLLPAVAEIGRRHVGYGVRDAHYATVGAALLATLAEGLGDAFDAETRAAWTAAYGLLASVMQAPEPVAQAA